MPGGFGFGSQASDNSYGRLPNGAGTWQNFIHDSGTPPTPLQINGLGFDDNKIMISEIMYHPYHRLYGPYYEAEDTNEEYIELYNSSVNSVALQDWQFINGIDFTFVGVSTIAPGGYLVVAADVGAFTAKYPSVTNVVGSWTGRLSNSGEKVELVNNNGVMIDSVRYRDEGNWAVRQQGPLDTNHNGWIWSDEHDGDGKSLELINPVVSNEYGQNWAASTVVAGTPGEANSAASADIAPLILNVSHFPVIPRSTDVVGNLYASSVHLDPTWRNNKVLRQSRQESGYIQHSFRDYVSYEFLRFNKLKFPFNWDFPYNIIYFSLVPHNI